MPSLSLTVRVPATTANLGPGFDCLGLALNIFNRLTVTSGEGFRVEVTGEGQDSLPRTRENLVLRAAGGLYRQAGAPFPDLAWRSHNRIPLARGLGSSAAAVVGGLVAANALLGEPFSREELLPLAAALEGHADNVAPALFGGCQVVVAQGEGWAHTSVPVPPGLVAVLFIPHFPIPTPLARQVLPAQVPREDAVYNIGRTALLVASLFQGELGPLRLATQDRLHQPYRRALFPAMESLFEAALRAGALGAFLSGAGPTVLALSREGGEAAIARAMRGAARRAGIGGKIRVARPTHSGARVVRK